MPDDPLRSTLADVGPLLRQLQSRLGEIPARNLADKIQHLTKGADDARMLMRAVLGPFEDLRRSLEQSTELQDIDSGGRWFQETLEQLQGQFHLPTSHEILKLFNQLGASGKLGDHSPFQDDASQCRRVIEAISTPWIDSQNPLRSLEGLLGLHQIGHELHLESCFDEESAQQLRRYLGDWRPRIDWPTEIFEDPLLRSDVYLQRGLDSGLTWFPAIAFDQAITTAGLKCPPPPYIPIYAHADYDRVEQNAGFKRNNAAHDLLQRFETSLRAFIDERMTAVSGKNWIKHRVSGDIRRSWMEKRSEALKAGEHERPLIAYADFTDYERVISQRNNWDSVFSSVFRRKSLLQESLQRLYPIRICTMHARIITQDDELYLHAEVTRLVRAMNIDA